MKLRFRALVVALASAALVTGTVAVAAPAQAATITYADEIAGDPTDIYLPSGLAPNQKLPFVLMLQGANVDKSHYSSYASQVAAQGFIVLVPNHDNAVLGGLFTGETQVSNTAIWAFWENMASGSPLKGHIDTGKMALLGHSFGGVTGTFAASGICLPPFCLGAYVRPSALKAAAFFGTNSTIAGITLPTLLNGVPVALIQGTRDGMALPTDTQTSYDLMVGAKRALVSLEGANHYGIANVNNPAGAEADANAPTIAQATAVSEAARWSAQWIKAQLGDPAAQAFVYTTGDAADPHVTVQTAP